MTKFKLFVLALALHFCAFSQADLSVFDDFTFRFIGPEGNRTIAIAGVPGDPMVNYIGAASGGLWKTTDGGVTWESIFDDQEAIAR